MLIKASYALTLKQKGKLSLSFDITTVFPYKVLGRKGVVEKLYDTFFTAHTQAKYELEKKEAVLPSAINCG